MAKRKSNKPVTVTREELEQVLVYLLRTNFYAFCRYYDSEFYSESKTHLYTLCSALQSVSDGDTQKLALSLPPRGGKSYTVSLWCAWEIGRHYNDPDCSIMRNSYGQSLAEKFSYDIRDVVRSDKYLDVFPEVELKKDHKRVEDWAVQTSKQSTYFCAGVGGAITGKGCKTAGILDDPIKNLEDALSETILEKTWGWVTSTHMSRFEKGCPQIWIQTRWSKKDPIGMLLMKEGVDVESGDLKDWTVIRIPAIDESGNSFCEDIKSTEEYEETKKLLDSFVWDAVYMQNPVEHRGLLFPPDDLNYFTVKEIEKYLDPKQKEEFDLVIGYTDVADEGSDYLASGALGIIGDKCYLLDVIYTQDPIEVTQPLLAQMILRTDQLRHKLESNNGGKGFGMEVKKLVREKGSVCSVKWKHQGTNKLTRIILSSGIVKEYIYFRNDYETGSQYDLFMRSLTEFIRIGKNKNDDAPDMVTGLAEMVAKGKKFRFLSNQNQAA